MNALIFKANVIQVEEEEFPVSTPLFWSSCPDECEPGWDYDTVTGNISKPIPPTKTVDEILSELSRTMTGMIKLEALSKHYDSAETVTTYTQSENPEWKAEAILFIAFRDSCWSYYLDIDTKCRSGEITPPTVQDFIEKAPKIDW